MTVLEDAERVLGRINAPNQDDLAEVDRTRVDATLAVAQEVRTTNRLLVALIDQMSAIAEAMPDLKHVRPGARIGIRSYLPQSDWDRLEVDV